MTDAQITLLIIGAAFVSMLLGTTIVRRRRTPLDLRVIPGYAILPVTIDEAVESDHLPHFSPGTSSVGDGSTMAALASADLMYYLVRRLSFERRLPLVTLSDPITLAVAADTLRKAYLARDNLETYRPNAVAWFPQGEGSLAFAAGAASLATDMDVSSHILTGRFGSEIALIGDASMRRNQRLIANSTTLEGQAVAFVMSDNAIIGEELFVSNAYMDRDSSLAMGSLITLDTLRWLVIIFGILLGILSNGLK